MIKYAKIIDNETGLCEIGTGTNIEFYKSIGMVELDVEQSEKDNAWYLAEKCPHYTEEEKEEKRKAQEIEILKVQLTELDTKRIRAICENEIKDETTGETWLEYYNKQVIACRKRLQEIQTVN